MKIDALTLHSDDMGDVVGSFYGIPIRIVNYFNAELREIEDAQIRARRSLGIASIPLEILPGEVIKDNLIRRETTAEVVGETFYDKAQGIEELKSEDHWDNYYKERG